MILCKYGCGGIAQYDNRCERSANSCPKVRRKNSVGLKRQWKTRVSNYSDLPVETRKRMAWSKGLSIKTDERVKRHAEKIRGVRRIDDKEKLAKRVYWERCQFNLGESVNKVLGYDLLVELGMFNKITNKAGVVRDHRLSINDGYRLGIDPNLICHPANCRFLSHKDNASKTFKSEIGYDELLKCIEVW